MIDDREAIMQDWDKWRAYIAGGGGGSYPRDAFESLLDEYDEKIERLAAEVERLTIDRDFWKGNAKLAEAAEQCAQENQGAAEAERDRLRDIVRNQAEDAGLWFQAKTAPEGYLQQELRKLHAAIEGKSQEDCARAALKGESRDG